ncbi:MAG: zinc ribbon domain-containing protein [Lachnospiraceae bacterium]|nr:zinc ribbon domain-containing protein [Lachnospiraceae bacterium]
MFCENCGREIPENTKFCEFCGAAQPIQGNAAGSADFDDERELLKGEKVTENVWLCPDGFYRWIYEYRMLQNPVILVTVWKVIALAFAIVYLFMVVLNLATNSMYGLEGFLSLTKGFALLLLFFLALGVVAYIILAGIYGWKYMVLFEMNEQEIQHIQMKKQFKKAEAVGWLTAAAGIAAGRIGMVGTGILAASRSSSVSEFSKVRTVKGSRMFNTIKVNQLLERNQVYAEPADYDFVYRYIAERCVNAKKIS